MKFLCLAYYGVAKVEVLSREMLRELDRARRGRQQADWPGFVGVLRPTFQPSGNSAARCLSAYWPA